MTGRARLRWMTLDMENAGVVRGWLVSQGVRAVMRGGPKGGSIGGTVIVPSQAMVIEPGDECAVTDGQVVLR